MDLDRAWREFAERPDERAFAAIFEATKGDVYTIARRMLRDSEDAAEALQETFVRLVATAKSDPTQLQATSPIVALRRLVVLESDSLRKRRARRAKRETTVEEPPMQIDDRPGPREDAARAEIRARVEALVEQLPENERLAVFLHYFHGLTHREIAEALAIPPGTVSARIARAHKRLEKPMRRAGLENVAGVLAGIAAGAGTLAPPATVTAASVYLNAVATPALVPAITSGVAIVKAKFIAAAAIIVAFVTIGVAVYTSGTNEEAAPSRWEQAMIDAHEREVAALGEPTQHPPREQESQQAANHSGDSAVYTGSNTAPNTSTDQSDGTVTAETAVLFGIIRHEGDGARAEGVAVRVLGFDPVTTTNSNGEFELSGLPEGAGRVLAVKENLRGIAAPDQSLDVTLRPGERTGPIEILLREASVSAGRVLDAHTQEALDDVSIHLEGNNEVYTDTTAEGGVYLFEGLEPGDYTMILKREGYRDGEFRFSLRTGALARRDVTIHRAGRLTVRVQDANGSPIAAARLSNPRIDGTAHLYPDGTSRTGPDGAIVVENFPMEVRVTLMVAHDEYTGTASQSYTLPYGEPEGEVVLILDGYTPMLTMEGVVLDAETNEPVVGAQIHSHYRVDRSIRIGMGQYSHSASSRNTFRTAESDGYGRYSLQIEGDATEITLGAWSDFHEESYIEEVLFPEGTGTLVQDFTLKPAGTITGRVIDEEGFPIEGANIWASGLARKTPRMGNSLRTDGTGEFTIGGVGEDPVRIQASATGYKTEFVNDVIAGRRLEIRLSPEEPTTKPRLYGHVVDAETGDDIRDFVVAYTIESRMGATPAAGTMTSGPRTLNMGTDDGLFELEPFGSFLGDQHGTRVNVVIRADGYRSESESTDWLMPESGNVTLQVALHKDSMVRGRIVSISDGAPVQGAMLEFVSQGTATATKTTSDELGSFEIPVPGIEDIRVTHPDFSQQIVAGDLVREVATAGSDLIVELAAGAAISVHWDLDIPFSTARVFGGGYSNEQSASVGSARGVYTWRHVPIGTPFLSIYSQTPLGSAGHWSLSFPLLLEESGEFVRRASDFLDGRTSSFQFNGTIRHSSFPPQVLLAPAGQEIQEGPSIRLNCLPGRTHDFPAPIAGDYTIRIFGGAGLAHESTRFLTPGESIVIDLDSEPGSP